MINPINYNNQIYNNIQYNMKYSKISFKSDSVEISDKEKKNYKKTTKDRFAKFTFAALCILAFIAGTQASVILEAFGYKIGLCNRRK